MATIISVTAVEASIHDFSPDVRGSKPAWTIVTGSCVEASSSHASGSSACATAVPAWYMPRARARLGGSPDDAGGSEDGAVALLSSAIISQHNTPPLSGPRPWWSWERFAVRSCHTSGGGQDLPGLLHSRTLSQWHTMHRPRFSSRALGIHGLWSMGYSKEPFWFIEAAGP